MRLTKLFCFLLFFTFLGEGLLFSQKNVESETLIKKAHTNFGLMQNNPQKAIIETNKLLNEAIKKNDHEAELLTLRSICAYYRRQNDFKNLIVSSEKLLNRATSYDKLEYKAIAKENLAIVYLFNELYNKAFKELEESLSLINKVERNDQLVIDAKANIYVSLSNYYSQINDINNRFKYIKLSMIEHNKCTDIEYKRKLQYIDYSNLAGVYYEKNLDSAKIYAQKSISLEKNYGLDDVSFCNYLILGAINQKRKNYLKSISFYQDAEKVVSFKNHINVGILYQNMIDVYNELHDSSNVIKYENKLNKLNLKISENKNKSLHKIIDEKEINDKSKTYQFIIIVSIFMIIGLLIVAFFVIRKNIILANYEKNSQEYLKNKISESVEQDFNRLIEMFKKNDLAFLTSFYEVYPDFSAKLQSINPKVVQTEIEFCAFLKLNIPTKEIARYRNIEHRTVQNKKYLIRKKLNIPKNVDIYYWFSNL